MNIVVDRLIIGDEDPTEIITDNAGSGDYAWVDTANRCIKVFINGEWTEVVTFVDPGRIRPLPVSPPIQEAP
jgi:hypothetical protein